MYVPEMEEKIKEIFLVFNVSVFELGLANSQNHEQDTWYRQSMC